MKTIEEPAAGDVKKPQWLGATPVTGLASTWWGPHVSGTVKKMHPYVQITCLICITHWRLIFDDVVHFVVQNEYADSFALCVGLSLTLSLARAFGQKKDTRQMQNSTLAALRNKLFSFLEYKI